jgi:hypothetical protein
MQNASFRENLIYFSKLYIPHLAYRLRDDINPDQIPLGIAGEKEKTGPVGVICQSGSNQGFPVFKSHFHFFPGYLNAFRKGFSLLVSCIPGEIFDKKNPLQVFDLHFNLLARIACARWLKVKSGLVGKKVLGETLEDPAVIVMKDDFGWLHLYAPSS